MDTLPIILVVGFHGYCAACPGHYSVSVNVDFCEGLNLSCSFWTNPQFVSAFFYHLTIHCCVLNPVHWKLSWKFAYPEFDKSIVCALLFGQGFD
jgi:hypothetical protein